MKTLVLILGLTLFVATSAFAVVETRSDNVGVYWDLTADNCCTPAFDGSKLIHFILTNPSFDGLYGFELGWNMVSVGTAPYLLGVTFGNDQALDVAPGFDNFIVGYGAPTDCSALDAVLLVSVELGNFGGAATDIKFFLTAAEPPSEGATHPVLLLANDILQEAGTHTDTPFPSAYMGSEDCGTVAVESTSWDSLKSLYR